MKSEKQFSKFLIVIDMQNDFITGSLKVEQENQVVQSVVEKINSCGEQTLIILTQDTHESNYLTTKEGKHIPIEHCMKGTWGHEIVAPVKEAVEGHPYVIWEKPTTGDHRIGLYIKEHASVPEENLVIELVGVCTDICVISNALILNEQFPNTELFVLRKCCSGSTELSHTQSLDVMQKNLITVC